MDNDITGNTTTTPSPPADPSINPGTPAGSFAKTTIDAQMSADTPDGEAGIGPTRVMSVTFREQWASTQSRGTAGGKRQRASEAVDGGTAQ